MTFACVLTALGAVATIIFGMAMFECYNSDDRKGTIWCAIITAGAIVALLTGAHLVDIAEIEDNVCVASEETE